MMRRTFSKLDVHCAAEGCDVRIGKGKLFCKGHYFSLPKALRDRLWSAWRAAMSAYARAPRLEQDRLNREYQQAYQDCREHLRTVRPTSAEAMTTTAYDARDFASPHIEGGAPKEFRYVAGRML